MAKNTRKFAIGCDHAALDMKEIIAARLEELGYEVDDVGTHTSDSCDYPVFAHAVAEKVAGGECDGGVLICGSGIGMSMAANKVPGVRAVVCTEPYSAYLSRQHNNSNVLCFGARLVGRDMAFEILRAWLETEFEGGRHERRVEMIERG